jgi:hypothetical protein
MIGNDTGQSHASTLVKQPSDIARRTVAAYLRIDAPHESLGNPQVGPDSSTTDFQAAYWRTASVFYATSRRANPEARHLLFTNGEPPIVDGRDIGAFLRGLGVEFLDVPYSYCPPPGYYELWRNQFYVLDIISYLSDRPSHSPFLILDLDCVFVASGNRLFEVVETTGVANYLLEETEADPEWSWSGLTKAELQQVANEIAGHRLPHVHSCGGGIFGATWEVAKTIAAAAPGVWQICVERHGRGLPKLNTEEHVLSYLYTALGLPMGTVNGLMRVIWTRPRYRTALESDLDLDLWHLPAEKKYGFRRVFSEVMDPTSPFWRLSTDAMFARYLGVRFGVPTTRLAKTVWDGRLALPDRLRHGFRRPRSAGTRGGGQV